MTYNVKVYINDILYHLFKCVVNTLFLILYTSSCVKLYLVIQTFPNKIDYEKIIKIFPHFSVIKKHLEKIYFWSIIQKVNSIKLLLQTNEYLLKTYGAEI